MITKERKTEQRKAVRDMNRAMNKLKKTAAM
jgi:hypothetical protein